MDRSLAIGGVLYEIISPSVRNVSLAQEYLKELPEENNLKEIFSQLDKERLCKILSCFIKGDLSLVDKLKEDSKEILVDILSIEYEDILRDIAQKARNIIFVPVRTVEICQGSGKGKTTLRLP